MPVTGLLTGARGFGFFSGLSAIRDLFSRTTTGTLGSADTGQVWNTLRGTWFANGSQAQSNDAGSTYALASVSFGSPNASTSVSTTPGVGPAFWITDANNWWASFSETTTTTSCIAQQTNWGTSVPNCPCGTVTSTTVTSTNWMTAPINFCPSGWALTLCGNTSSSCTSACRETCGWPADGCGDYYSCCRTTVTQTLYACTQTQQVNTAHALRIVSMVGGTVSNAVSNVALGSSPAAIRVITNGNSVTATAFSNTDMTSAIGTNTANPVSPNLGTSTGIVKAPSAANQGSTADNFVTEVI